MKAWITQTKRNLAKFGAACPWSVGWYDPAGKRRSRTRRTKAAAETELRKIEGQLAAGTYQSTSRAKWEEFTAVLEERLLAGMKASTRDCTQNALNHFERIMRPGKVARITTATIADYVAKRRQERTRKAPAAPLVSPATINLELRVFRAVFRKAHKWGYLPSVPEFDFLREPGKLQTYITPEHFGSIYGQCSIASWPELQSFTPADWWRGLVIFGYMTGWRIGSMLALRWDDVDLEKGQALSRAENNKGNRDQFIPLHPIVVDHLRKLRSFSPLVFPWNHGRRSLYDVWGAILAAAGVPRYGFHDLRRAFATMNAENLSASALQTLMQHKDYQTTLRYINMARQLHPVAEKLYVPNVPPLAASAGS